MDKLNILILNTEVEFYFSRVRTLARLFTARGHNVTVLCNIRHEEAIRGLTTKIKPVAGINYYYPPILLPHIISSPRYLKLSFIVNQLILTILMGIFLTYIKGVDVIYAANAQTYGFIGTVLSRLTGRPLTVDYGDAFWGRDNKHLFWSSVKDLLFFCENVTLRGKNLSCLITDDPVISDYVSDRYHRSSIFLPMGYMDYFRKEVTKPRIIKLKRRYDLDGSSVILYAGKLNYLSLYRLDMLIYAASIVAKRFQNVKFVLLGHENPAIQKLVESQGLEKVFIFPGFVEHTEMPYWIELADICIQVTSDACIGGKTSEYMIRGKPVISAGSWYNRYRHFLLNGINCMLTPLNPLALADSIVYLLQNPHVRETLSKRAQETIEKFSWNNIAEIRLELMSKLIVDRSKAKGERR